MSQPKYLKGACQHCGGHLEFPVEATGTVADCPHCGKSTELMLLAPEMEPALPRKTIIWTIVAVVVLVAGLFGALAALKRAKGIVARRQAAASATAQTNEAAAQDPIAKTGFRISAVTLEKTPGSSLVYAVGTLTNLEKRQRFGVKVELDLLDSTGTKVGAAADYQQVLEPNGQWQFRALVVNPKPVASAKVREVKEQQ